MESKKFNIFSLLLMVVMCVFSIYMGIGRNDNTDNFSNDILTIYKKLDNLDEKIDDSKGKSAYQIAVECGFEGTEGEWLQSLKGSNGTNALENVSVREIYTAYLETVNKTETDMSYDEFLTYYYSVIDEYDTKSATQLAYSTTVDICYSYYGLTYELVAGTAGNKPAYKINDYNVDESKHNKGGVGAGAGVIYKMLDTDGDVDHKLDTAYIITNYHVAYLDNYSNDPNYVVYYNTNTQKYFLGTKVADQDLLDGTDTSIFGTTNYKYFLEESIDILTVDEGISKHFLTGTNDQYYGIYLYGHQDEDYKLNASFVGGSADNDIAVLKIERDNISPELASIFFDSGNFFEASLGNSTDLVGGEEVIAVGNPLIPNTTSGMTMSQYEQAYVDALVLSSTTGVVSVISNETVFESLIDSTKTTSMRLIRVDAAINSGNSGGGLYDLYGRLVGVVNSKIASSSYDNVGYAIPVNIAISVAEQVISQCEGTLPVSQNTRIKTLKTESLGFEVENGVSKSQLITNSNGKKEWFVSYNVLVKNISESSVAYVAGLRNDDIIAEVSFDGNNYTSTVYFNLDYELRDLLLNVDLTTSKVTFKVFRGNSEQSIEINLSSENFVEIC